MSLCNARRHHLTQPEQCARAHLVHTYTHTHKARASVCSRRVNVYVYMLCPSYINNDSLHSKMADRQLHPNQTLRLRTAAVAVKNPRARANHSQKQHINIQTHICIVDMQRRLFPAHSTHRHIDSRIITISYIRCVWHSLYCCGCCCCMLASFIIELHARVRGT